MGGDQLHDDSIAVCDLPTTTTSAPNSFQRLKTAVNHFKRSDQETSVLHALQPPSILHPLPTCHSPSILHVTEQEMQPGVTLYKVPGVPQGAPFNRSFSTSAHQSMHTPDF